MSPVSYSELLPPCARHDRIYQGSQLMKRLYSRTDFLVHGGFCSIWDSSPNQRGEIRCQFIILGKRVKGDSHQIWRIRSGEHRSSGDTIPNRATTQQNARRRAAGSASRRFGFVAVEWKTRMNIDERDKENNDQTESLERGLRRCELRGSGAVALLGDYREVQEEKDPRSFPLSCLFLSAAAQKGRPGSRPSGECRAEGSRWPSNDRSRTSRSADVLPRSRAPGSMREEPPRRPCPRS